MYIFTPSHLQIYIVTPSHLQIYIFTLSHLQIYIVTPSHLQIYIFTPSHLQIYIFTPSHLQIYIFTPSHLLIYIFTPSHLLIYIFTPSHLQIYLFTPSHLLIYIFTPSHLQIYIFTPSHLQIYFLAPSHLQIFSPSLFLFLSFSRSSFYLSLKAGAVPPERHQAWADWLAFGSQTPTICPQLLGFRWRELMPCLYVLPKLLLPCVGPFAPWSLQMIWHPLWWLSYPDNMSDLIMWTEPRNGPVIAWGGVQTVCPGAWVEKVSSATLSLRNGRHTSQNWSNIAILRCRSQRIQLGMDAGRQHLPCYLEFGRWTQRSIQNNIVPLFPPVKWWSWRSFFGVFCGVIVRHVPVGTVRGHGLVALSIDFCFQVRWYETARMDLQKSWSHGESRWDSSMENLQRRNSVRCNEWSYMDGVANLFCKEPQVDGWNDFYVKNHSSGYHQNLLTVGAWANVLCWVCAGCSKMF